MDQQDQDICQVAESGPEHLHPDCVWHHHGSLRHGLCVCVCVWDRDIESVSSAWKKKRERRW